MPFFKRSLTAIGAILLIFFGGTGTQSSSALTQGTGVVALVVGIIILIVFGRMMWRATGCLVSILIIGGICSFILYSIGAFSNGIEGAPDRIKSFLGRSQGIIETDAKDLPNASPLTVKAPAKSQKKKASKNQPQAFNPLNYPAIIEPVRVIKGNVLQLQNGRYIRIFGIDAPDLTQRCSNRHGRSYLCGKQSKAWLKSWIDGYDIKCHILNTDQMGNSTASCFLGEYDLAAAIVNAGWGVATTEAGNIYKIYEHNANSKKNGLWQGQFYSPADWRNMKQTKADIKVIEAPKQIFKKGLFGF